MSAMPHAVPFGFVEQQCERCGEPVPWPDAVAVVLRETFFERDGIVHADRDVCARLLEAS